ncbi:SsgA family sporulation/cell division regulator [Streptomyces sp. WAC08241]|uniref:SsgA family sporulation/cell division regulator n=1 Tax=Streptomyces sp. WAC08241 TaxID=2487421 RepID=UPI000F7902A6|nr:SsgA family sporulation/cell division regulator [Streptomyces sp. WAC08241]RSS34165.1 SsgA family sporulation/cell division regulator [Streptomyces sp. WAC08241]
MSRPSSAVPPACREITWKTTAFLVADSCRVPLGATARYRSRSPFVIELTLHTPTGETVWQLDRDMFLAGTEGPVGIGEVHIRPAPYDQVVLRLGAPSHAALISLGRGPVMRWLNTTYTLVPAGDESSHLDWRPLLDVLAD